MELTYKELENIKELILCHEIWYQKLNSYASLSIDPQIKQFFMKEAQETLNTKQKLISFLNS